MGSSGSAWKEWWSRFYGRQQSPFDSKEEEGKEKEERALRWAFAQTTEKENRTHEREWSFIKGVICGT